VTRTFRRRRLPNARPSSSKTNPRTHSPEQIAQISAFHGRLRSTARKDHPHRPTGRKRVHGYGPVREVRAEDRDHRARRERHRQRITRRVQYSPRRDYRSVHRVLQTPRYRNLPLDDLGLERIWPCRRHGEPRAEGGPKILLDAKLRTMHFRKSTKCDINCCAVSASRSNRH
jgi:hypothetical protein